MSSKFKVGDRVMAHGTVERKNVDGCIGTIIKLFDKRAYVRFDENIGGWGSDVYGMPMGHGFAVPLKKLTLIHDSMAGSAIYITTDGPTTTAILEENGKVVKKATARYNPHDAENGNPFRFEIGARYAFNRLFDLPTAGILPEDKQIIRVVKQDKYEVGDKVLIVDKWTPDCHAVSEMDKWLGKVMTVRQAHSRTNSYSMEEDSHDSSFGGWYWFPAAIAGKVIEKQTEPSKPKFVPHLRYKYSKNPCGTIGAETVVVDVVGNKLRVGDTVHLFSGTKYCGECAVVINNRWGSGGYVMGAFGGQFHNGISGSFKIMLCRKYEDIPDGETVDAIEYIKTEATANGE